MRHLKLSLLGGFELRRDGGLVALPISAQRLVAFLWLHHRPLKRHFVAWTLWPDVSEERAYANLRSTVWRLRRASPDLVLASRSYVRLAPEIVVDVSVFVQQANDLLESQRPTFSLPDFQHFAYGLLPDWYDEWLLEERERLHQLRLHVLECVSERLIAEGRYCHALEAALIAAHDEPLRESAQRLLIRIHLLEGNEAEALRVYHWYRDRLQLELGIAPSEGIEKALESNSL